MFCELKINTKLITCHNSILRITQRPTTIILYKMSGNIDKRYHPNSRIKSLAKRTMQSFLKHVLPQNVHCIMW